MRVLVYSADILQNELICEYANVVHILVHSVHSHTHILKPFEDSKLTGLKVYTALNTVGIPRVHVLFTVGN